MAGSRIRVFADKDFEEMFSKLGKYQDSIARKAIYAGAKVLADAVRIKIEGMTREKFRYLWHDTKFKGITNTQKKDLLDGLGVAPIKVDAKGNYDTHIGFDGYGSYPTKTYPNGVPNQLLARAIESGSSVRKKEPFIRPTFNRVKNEAEAEMAEVLEKEIQKLIDMY